MLVLAVALWLITERLPLGRHIYAIGANEKAAALNGIPVRAYVIGVFVASGLIAGFTGCVLASKLQIGQANVGLDYLLPALVGAFLGSTTIKPGRVNVWGTIVGVLILAVGISGIQQLGGAFFVEPLFNGTTLRRRDRARRLRPAPPLGANRRASIDPAGHLSRAGTNDTGSGRRTMVRSCRTLQARPAGLCRGVRARSARSAIGARRDDAYMAMAKAYIAKVTATGRAVDRPDDRARRRRARS